MTTSRSPSEPLPAPAEVTDGVWAIALPLPQSPIGSVLLYAVEHDDGLLLIDAGYDDEACWNALVAGLTLAGRSVADVTGVVLTHCHPDHVGLAERVREASGAWVAINERDALVHLQHEEGTFLEQLDMELRLAGLPDEPREEMVEASRRLSRHAHQLRVDRFLVSGGSVTAPGIELRVIATPGHTRGHVCLHDESTGRLFGGDLLLTTGEIQLGVVSTPTDDPAGELLASLELVRSLPVSLVLPGHGSCFTDAAERATSAIAALESRIASATQNVRAHPGLTAWERCEQLTWSRNWERMSSSSRRFAVMQLMAWLRRLSASGAAVLDPGPPERMSVA
jgi:glyoxylase-like metal-dependent hydrolase (beta-lactamase superfamily II)